jgi:hypothetical protein
VIYNHVIRRAKSVPTKRAPDVWESAAFSSIFLASGFFCPQSESTLRPHAGNAHRWAAMHAG